MKVKYPNPLLRPTPAYKSTANKRPGDETKTDGQRNQEIANRAKEEARFQKSRSGRHWIV